MRDLSDGTPAPGLSGRHRRVRGGATGLRPGAHRETTWAVHARPRSRRSRPRHARLVVRTSRGVGSGVLAGVVAFALVSGVGVAAAADHTWRDGAGLESVGELVRAGTETVRRAGTETVRRATVLVGREIQQPDRGAEMPSAADLESSSAPELKELTELEPMDVPEPSSSPEPEPTSPSLPEGLNDQDIAAGVLGPEAPASGDGEFDVVPGQEDPPAEHTSVRTVQVEVERGLDLDGEVFAGMVMATLNDPRGWGAEGTPHTGLGFARTDGDAELRVVLATPATVDEMCAPLTTESRYSCAINGAAVLNAERWWWATEEYAEMVAGADADPADVDRTVYRQYLVNHEVGHLLGQGHVDCTGEGEPAPVMQQQTVQIAPCVPEAWPAPDA